MPPLRCGDHAPRPSPRFGARAWRRCLADGDLSLFGEAPGPSAAPRSPRSVCVSRHAFAEACDLCILRLAASADVPRPVGRDGRSLGPRRSTIHASCRGPRSSRVPWLQELISPSLALPGRRCRGLSLLESVHGGDFGRGDALLGERSRGDKSAPSMFATASCDWIILHSAMWAGLSQTNNLCLGSSRSVTSIVQAAACGESDENMPVIVTPRSSLVRNSALNAST
mmetsp:Transcript_32761/g.91188  ORF Transcript_32761/g.91188 Transcript_32761/m.91188 type:complete len:226 (+) Transcript_32761:207-884(+)